MNAHRKIAFTGLSKIMLYPLLLVLGNVAQAESESMDSGSAPAARHPLTENISYGIRVEAEYASEENYLRQDGLDSQGSDVKLVTPAVSFQWRGPSGFSAYGNIEVNTPMVLTDHNSERDDQNRIDLDKLYLNYLSADKTWLITLGRQRVKDSREWLFDDTLDGLSVSYTRGSLQLSGYLVREQVVTTDLLHDEGASEVDHVWLNLESAVKDDLRYALFYLTQRDKARDEKVHWYGAQVNGEVDDLDYWAQVGRVGGTRRSKDVSGYGFDLGGVYRLLKRPRVYLIAGYAFGSGDDDDVDLGYRQTDLQDNSAKLGGISRIAYYGEVFDPELGNLAIATLGIGMRPVRDISVDLLWHRYHQETALDELRKSAFDAEPTGEHRGLGSEIDLVFGWRWQNRFKVEAAAGLFQPGPAFAQSDINPLLLRLETRYEF